MIPKNRTWIVPPIQCFDRGAISDYPRMTTPAILARLVSNLSRNGGESITLLTAPASDFQVLLCPAATN